MNEPIYIDRPPRIQPELPFDEIEIPAPPDKEESGYSQLIQMALPLMTIIGYVLITVLAQSGRSPLMLIPMAMSVLASTGFSIYTYRKENQRREEIERAYEERLVELNKEMNDYHDEQRRFYRYNYPDRSTTFRIVQNARLEVEKAERTLRSESRLWERRVSDDDFGVVRLGMGTLPSTVTYVLGEVENFDDPQVRGAMKLEEDSKFVPDIPVIISFRQAQEEEEEEEFEKDEEETETGSTPFTHALGIAGERQSVYEYSRAMLAHFVTFHAPMDAKLYVLATHKEEWAWTDYLPHSREDEQSVTRCFLDQIEEDEGESGFDEDEEGAHEQFLEGVRKVLATRRIRMQDKDETQSGGGDPTLPFMLVVIDLMDAIYDDSSPFGDLESDAAVSILIEQGAVLGAAVVFLVPERSKVPSGCKSVIEIERTTPATNSISQQFQRLHFRYTEIGVNTFRYVGEADYIGQPEHMNALAQKLAQLEVRTGYGANLTNMCLFLDLMEYSSLRDLREDTWGKWQDSTLPRYSNWLKAKIGLMSGNKPRTLTFSAKKDGVHGMVAGSTGSGKSEPMIPPSSTLC
jgi:S-DNA-T family DNA segregation ATPase FtsK/SpoIIIE